MKPTGHYPSADDWLPPLVGLIGMGMEREDLSQRALRWIERAEILAGGKRHIELFPEHKGERILLQGPMRTFLEQLADLSRHKRTVVLASGDPLFFGIGRRLIEALGKKRILIFPNATTVQALFSRLAQTWEDVKVISLHGRGDQESESQYWLTAVRDFPKVALFTDPAHGPDWIGRRLCEAGMADNRRLVVAQDLGAPNESLLSLSPEEACNRSFSALNLVAVLAAEPDEGQPGFSPSPGAVPQTVLGLPEECFRHEAGLITKMEVRAVALAMLQLEPDQVLWDLGAASGSVAIEAARMGRLRKVFAVEKDASRYNDLVENIRRYRCFEVQPVHGSASSALGTLDDPDRVFIGGSGGELCEILNEAERRLRPGGRIVQAIVTLDTLETARSFLQKRHFQIAVTQMQVNRSVPIGKTHRLEALNPVFILAAWKERHQMRKEGKYS